MELADKVTLVTGAGAGIGRAAAMLFQRQGAKVVLCDRDEAALAASAEALAAAGGEPLAIAADVTDRAAVARVVEAAVGHFGRLDCAFNNAGIEAPLAEMGALTSEQWRQVIAVDLDGVFNCMQSEIEAMLERGGAIVNVASSLGLVGIRGQSAYSAAKHGVVGLTKSAAIEYASRGIRINAVCPGIVDTPMTARLLADAPGGEEAISLVQPIGRLGRPEEIAAAAAFLLGDGASFVIGAALPVDGGHVAQ